MDTIIDTRYAQITSLPVSVNKADEEPSDMSSSRMLVSAECSSYLSSLDAAALLTLFPNNI